MGIFGLQGPMDCELVLIKGEKEIPKVQEDFRGPIEEILKMK